MKKNIRTAVDKREIIKYLQFRERRLEEGSKEERSSIIERFINLIRQKEIGRLITLISQDTIRQKIKAMKKHYYLNKKNEN